jgi:hypothetical protein
MAFATFPKYFLDDLDEVLMADPVTGKFLASNVQWLVGRTVQVPKLSFTTGLQNYNRFASPDDAYNFSMEEFTLANNKEKQFYIDWQDANDFPTASTALLLSEFLRTKAMPEIEANFFTKVAAKAPTANTITVVPDDEDIQEQIDTAILALAQVGVTSGDVFMTAANKSLFEGAVQRVYTNETGVNTQVFTYNGWRIVMVPNAVFGTLRYLLVGDGCAMDVRKRTATHAFAPGEHQGGDGWLIQYRVIYDAFVPDNKAVGLYLNKPA